LDAAQQLT
jgi:hypothetical protein